MKPSIGDATNPVAVVLRNYFRLECIDCREAFGFLNTPKYRYPSLVSDNPSEFLYPDYEVVAEQVGRLNADRLEAWHADHRDHHKECVQMGYGTNPPNPDSQTSGGVAKS